MQKSKLIINGVALIILIMATMATALGQNPVPTTIEGWDCSQAANTGKCSRQLADGDIGWNWAGTLFGDNEKYTRFQEANPEKVSIRKEGKKIFLDWEAGTTVEINYNDLLAISKLPPTGETIVLQQKAAPQQTNNDPAATMGAFMVGKVLPWGIAGGSLLALLTFGFVGFVVWRQLQSNNEVLRENPLDPALSGDPMSSSVANFFNVTPDADRVRETLSNFSGTDGARVTGVGRRKATVRCQLTIPAGISVPTQFRTGNRGSRPVGTTIYLDVYYNEQNEVSDLVAAVGRCDNGLLMGSMSQTDLRTFASGSIWNNPVVINTSTDAPAFDWEQVLAFIRNMGAVTAETETTETVEETETIAADSPQAPPVRTGLTGQLTMDGFLIDSNQEIVIDGFGTLRLTGDQGAYLLPGNRIQLQDGGTFQFQPAAEQKQIGVGAGGGN